MAANDYYHDYNRSNQHTYSDHQDSSYHGPGAHGTRLDYEQSPLPSPLPPAQSEHYGQPSPYSSTFDDDRNSFIPPNQSTQHLMRPDSYASSGRHDPFRDSQSIPLQSNTRLSQYGKQDGATSPTAGMGHAEQFGGSGFDDDQKPRSKAKGWFKGRIPYAVYLLSLVQIIVFIVEIAKNAALTKSPIEIKPTFNPMIGPSPYVLINMGARYVPCMRSYEVPGKAPLTVAEIAMPCPNATTLDASCSLAQLCGFGLDLTRKAGEAQPQPNQWFRFIIPIFLHGGLIHIGFNLLLQLILGKEIELQIGILRFLLVYFSAGIFGFVLGGNYSPNGIASTGCSGSLFGILALVLLDLLYTWKTRKSPIRDLLFIMLDVVLAFVIGLLPGLDNFSHIGGFITGLVLGVCILRSPDALRQRIGLDDPPYAAMGVQGGNNINGGGDTKQQSGLQSFARKPLGFFKGRKVGWWVWWLVRVGALVAVFAGFIVLVTNFYGSRTECGWCKYLNCLPVKNWCEIGNLEFIDQPTKRSLDMIFGLGQSPAR